MYSTLVGELSKRRISKKQLATALGVHINTVYNKLYHGMKLDVEQCITIYKLYFMDSEIPWYELFKEG